MRQKVILPIIIIFILFSAQISLADGGDGSGGGTSSGGNSDIPLTLEGASINNGDNDVAINATIRLDFNKNICNVVVQPNNRKCFHLTSSDGETIPIQLIFPDDQTQTKIKNIVFITPLTDLNPNTSYQLAIDNTLLAKNGTQIENAFVLEFTTSSERTEEIDPTLEKLGINIVTYETAIDAGPESVPVIIEKADENNNNDLSNYIPFIAIGLIVVLIIVTAILIVLRKKSKNENPETENPEIENSEIENSENENPTNQDII